MSEVGSQLPIICDAENTTEKTKFLKNEEAASQAAPEQENNSTDSQSNSVING